MTEQHRGTWQAWTRRVTFTGDAEALFAHLYGSRQTAVWLDSAHRAYDMGRFSIMGAPETSRDHVLEYDAAASRVTVDGSPAGSELWGEIADRIDAHPVSQIAGIPFAGGYVGAIGYGAKQIGHGTHAPDAQLTHLSRFLVIDHAAGELIAVAVGPAAEQEDADAWIAHTLDRATACEPLPAPADTAPAGAASASVTREKYLDDLGTVRTWLAAGDSYEACYTYSLHFPFSGDGFEVYRRLRRDNAAPYAAFLRLPGRDILSCSPERFLTVAPDGWAETKPIKGTARRHLDPAADAEAARALAADPKTRAENLMIVDLLRNDLGRVSAPGTVTVPRLMGVESYATVHQLVTSVRSKLLPRSAAGVCAAEALFPPGSMTGAPKKRTVEMLDDLEAVPRGVYSGVVGFFSADGAVDLSVVIRTAVIENGEARIGTGGAITYDSVPEDELDETIAKSGAVLRAFGRTHPFAG
ncbi:aminodeoxychorismate synthase component I [Microbacterium amylolyticum]|uniref:aminodeoxychorismate synthase n=1 Tax=Microbacterium amylolyticum TaxID=936337 RepID=A0ABS4ZGE9_9MICO|nr:aminodeoxychorismate synthase component I [Microbacterium amylolyticum]MBP2436363.1 para-aminobenzoate synthetase [Microbacterium amylolyticum]